MDKRQADLTSSVKRQPELNRELQIWGRIAPEQHKATSTLYVQRN